MDPVLALSLSGPLTDVGALAGLAAILGIAVLSLLYFAQAREVKRLREWAGRAPERAQELQDRVAADKSRSAGDEYTAHASKHLFQCRRHELGGASALSMVV